MEEKTYDAVGLSIATHPFTAGVTFKEGEIITPAKVSALQRERDVLLERANEMQGEVIKLVGEKHDLKATCYTRNVIMERAEAERDELKEKLGKILSDLDTGVVAKESSFPWALIQLKQGHHMTRRGWNGKGQFVAMAETQDLPDTEGRRVGPFLFIGRECCGRCNTWVPSISDLFAEDWIGV